jgi:hypothetical protein
VTDEDCDDYEVSLRKEPHALYFSRYSVYLKSSQTKCLLRERSFLNARCQNSEINDITEKKQRPLFRILNDKPERVNSMPISMTIVLR